VHTAKYVQMGCSELKHQMLGNLMLTDTDIFIR